MRVYSRVRMTAFGVHPGDALEVVPTNDEEYPFKFVTERGDWVYLRPEDVQMLPKDWRDSELLVLCGFFTIIALIVLFNVYLLWHVLRWIL